MSSNSLQIRLNPLFDSLKQTQHLITRLSKLPSTPGSSPNNPDEGDARVELSREIHESLKEQEEDFELIWQEAEDLTSSPNWTRRRDSNKDSQRERERNDLASQVARLGEDLKIARAQFRKAQVQAKRNAEAAQRQERQLLFAGIQEGSPKDSATGGYGRRKGQEGKTHEDLVLGASNDVTAALRRTHNLMSNELERSHFAQETLQNSSRELASLTETYSNLDTLLSSSKNLVGTLIRSQKSDTWYLETAFYILSVTIGWLVFRRLIYGPAWWFLYFPLRTVWWIITSVARILFGSLAAVSATVGAKNQNALLSQAPEFLGSSISGTGSRVGIPTFTPDMPAPSVKVGGGGYGAEAEVAQQQAGGSENEESMSDRVGDMAEKSQPMGNEMGEQSSERQGQQEETVLKERTAEDGPPNPKKRMWEEPLGGNSQGNRPRDEL